MNTFTRISQLTLIVCVLSLCAFAQGPLASTTLTGALTSSATTACLASATSVVTPSLALGQLGSVLVVDAEAMQVTAAGPTSTCFKVKRGQYANTVSNVAAAHGNGQKVWVLGQTISTGDTSRPVSTTAFLAQRPFQPFEVMATPSLFGVTAAAVTDVAGKIWYGAMEVDVNTFASGACILNGATVGTDKWIVALYDSTGALLANSALAGTTTAGASQYQCIAFTSPIGLLGPSQYFVALQGNGTTDKFQSYATGAAHSSYPTGSQTGTFGILPSITVTTTFTASVGPLMTLY